MIKTRQKLDLNELKRNYSLCPDCKGVLLKPTTLANGKTVCQSCSYPEHPTQPNVTIQALIPIILKSETLEHLKNTTMHHIECPICFQTLDEPTTLSCGHTFCRSCLCHAIDYQHTCPYCRDPINTRLPDPTQLLIQLLSEFESRPCVQDDGQIPILLGQLAFPSVPCTIHIFEPRHRHMIRNIMKSQHKRMGVSLTGQWGTMIEFMHVQTLSDGRSWIEAIGTYRFSIRSLDQSGPYPLAQVEPIQDLSDQDEWRLEQEAILIGNVMRAREPSLFDPRSTLTRQILMTECVASVLALADRFRDHAWFQRLGPPPVHDQVRLSWWCLDMIPVQQDEKSKLLQITCVRERLLVLLSWLDRFQNFIACAK